MAYSAYCDTASATKWWIIGTGSSVNRLSEVMDDNASGVEEDDNPGNYQPWSTFMTEHVEDGLYQIHLDFEIGDDSTATTLEILLELVYFDDDTNLKAKDNAILNLGNIHEGWGIFGSSISLHESADYIQLGDGGNINIGASMIINRGSKAILLGGGTTLDARNFIFNGVSDTSDGAFGIQSNIGGFTFKNAYFNSSDKFTWYATPTEAVDVHLHNIDGYALSLNQANAVFSGMKLTDVKWGYRLYTTSDPVLVLNNPKQVMGFLNIGDADSWIKERYPVNIHIVDKDGSAISGASVLIEDVDGETVTYEDSETDLNEALDLSETGVDVDDGTKFSADTVIKIGEEFMYIDSISTNTLTVQRGYYTNYPPQRHIDNADIYIVQTLSTDGSGDITEQNINYKQWSGTSETLKDYSVHTFTISKAGYETLILENITVDAPIVWHLELKGPVRHKVGSDTFFQDDS